MSPSYLFIKNSLHSSLQGVSISESSKNTIEN